MITSATIRHIQCSYCKKYVTGSFLFIHTHEQNCKTRSPSVKTVVPIKDSSSQNIQVNKMQVKNGVVKPSRF